LQVIEIRRAVFVEPRVIVDLLVSEERDDTTSERRSMTEMLEMYHKRTENAQAEGRLEILQPIRVEDEEFGEGEGEGKSGCKVILEDVYLESVSQNTHLPR
jgi:hypothetical protein